MVNFLWAVVGVLVVGLPVGGCRGEVAGGEGGGQAGGGFVPNEAAGDGPYVQIVNYVTFPLSECPPHPCQSDVCGNGVDFLDGSCCETRFDEFWTTVYCDEAGLCSCWAKGVLYGTCQSTSDPLAPDAAPCSIVEGASCCVECFAYVE